MSNKIAGPDMRRNAMEYMFYYSVLRLNNSGYTFTARNACDLRRQYNHMFTGDNVKNKDNMAENLNIMFRDYFGGRDVWPKEENGQLNDDFTALMNGFFDMTGYGRKSVAAPIHSSLQSGSSVVVEDGHCVLPISPYDPDFSGRFASRQYGTELMFLSDEDMPTTTVKGKNGETVVQARTEGLRDISDTSFMADANVYTRKDGTFRTINGNNGPMKFIMDDDFSGMARLMPYMDKMDYIQVRDRVNSAGLIKNPDGEYAKIGNRYRHDISKYTPPDAMDKAEAILRYLQDNGYSYSVESDMRAGQLKAKVKGTRAEIRLMDPYTPSFVGRVYDNGAISSCNKRTSNRGFSGNETEDRYVPTIEDTLAVVKSAIGAADAGSYIAVDNDGNSYYEKYHKTPYAEPRGSYDVVNRAVTNQAISRGEYARTRYDKTPNAFFNTPGKAMSKPLYIVQTQMDRGYRNDVVREYVDVKNRTVAPVYFATDVEAEKWLRDAVDRAKENFKKEVGLTNIQEEAAAHSGEDYEPELSRSNYNSAELQYAYYDFFTGKTDGLRMFKIVRDDEDDETDTDDTEISYDEDSDVNEAVRDSSLTDTDYFVCSVDSSDKFAYAQAHLDDAANRYIGQYEPGEDGKRFNPALVMRYMDDSQHITVAMDKMTEALKKVGIGADELHSVVGQNVDVANRLVEFDEATSHFMCDDDNSFCQSMYKVISDSIAANGGVVEKDKDTKKPCIYMDEQGIVKYSFKFRTKESGDASASATKTGYLGQIFAPLLENHGAVFTNFASKESNYMFVPGYRAYVTAQAPGQHKDFEERIRFKGYEQMMADAIRYAVRDGAITGSSVVGAPYNLNGVYRRLYCTHHDVDYFDKTREAGMSDEMRNAILEDEANQVTFDSDFAEGSSINKTYQAKANPNRSISLNDHIYDPFVLTDGHNMGVVNYTKTREVDGKQEEYIERSKIFADIVATGKAQIKKRILKKGVVIGVDGVAVPPPEGSSGLSPLAEYEAKSNHSYSLLVMADRASMVNNVSSHARRQTGEVGVRPINVAQMPAGGWNFDDGIPISKEFAEAYQVVDEKTGKMRPMQVGDKICNRYGNKQVVSIVVDRDMPIEEAREKKIEKLVQTFKDNPELDAIAAPFSFVSRFDGGTAREIGETHKDLILRDENGNPVVHHGCMGQCVFKIAEQTVDNKLHLYNSNGRKVSAQNTMAFASKDADNLMHSFFAGNTGAVKDFREMLIVTGYDISEAGQIHKGYRPHNGEERNVFELPEGKDDLESLSSYFSGFVDDVGRRGGFLELPFNLKMKSGDTLPIVREETYTDENGVEQKHKVVSSDFVEQTGDKYGLPILSKNLRSGQEQIDGDVILHDYTIGYKKIFMSAAKYMLAEKAMTEAQAEIDKIDVEYDLMGDMDSPEYEEARREFDEKIKKSKSAMSKYEGDAQAAFDSLSGEVRERCFDTKHNMARDSLMSVRTSDSATAVMIPDPTLPINMISMGTEIADHVTPDKFAYSDEVVRAGVAEANTDMDGVAFVVRPPVMKDSNQRCMGVVKREGQNCIGMNPVLAVCFRGDFDGDTLGAHKISSTVAQEEAFDAYSFKANMLDRGVADENGNSPLSINIALDLKVAEYVDSSIADRFDDITKRLNDIEREGEQRRQEYFDSHPKNGKKSVQTEQTDDSITTRTKSSGDEQLWRQREEIFNELNDVVQESFDKSFGQAVISYSDELTHLTSVWHACIETGAKGSPSKFESYARAYGVETTDGTSMGDEIARLSKYYDAKTQCYDYDKMKKDGTEPHIHSVIECDENGIVRNPLITDDMSAQTQTATDIKSEGTGTAGTFANNGIAALRNVCPDAVTMDTEVVVQGILQAKHDALAAMKNYEILTVAAKQHWKGKALKPDPRSGKWTVDKGHRATTEEWIETHSLMMTGKYTNPKTGETKLLDDIAPGVPHLGMEINPDHTRRMAEALTIKPDMKNTLVINHGMSLGDDFEPGHIMNVETEARCLYGTPIDRLAYAPRGTGFKVLQQLAKEGAYLYDGFETLAPTPIVKNMQLDKANEAYAMTPIAAKDVLVTYTPRVKVEDKLGVVLDTSKDRTVRKPANEGPKENIDESGIDSSDLSDSKSHGDAGE